MEKIFYIADSYWREDKKILTDAIKQNQTYKDAIERSYVIPINSSINKDLIKNFLGAKIHGCYYEIKQNYIEIYVRFVLTDSLLSDEDEEIYLFKEAQKNIDRTLTHYSFGIIESINKSKERDEKYKLAYEQERGIRVLKALNCKE